MTTVRIFVLQHAPGVGPDNNNVPVSEIIWSSMRQALFMYKCSRILWCPENMPFAVHVKILQPLLLQEEENIST